MKELSSNNNFLGLAKKYSSLAEAGIVVLPIKMKSESKVKNISVTPIEIIKSSHRLERYDEEMSCELALEKGIAALAPLDLQKSSYLAAVNKIRKVLAPLLNEQKFVVSICSQHSASYGIIAAHHDQYQNLSILHIDSRAHLKSETESANNNDCLFTRISDFNSRIVQVGVRSLSKEESEFRKKKQIRQFLASEIKLGMYGKDWQEIINRNFTENVYITIDLSGFDPSVFRSVENPEPGGLVWDEFTYLVKIIGQDRNIVGLDVTGLIPGKDDSISSYSAAKLIYKILAYSFHKK